MVLKFFYINNQLAQQVKISYKKSSNNLICKQNFISRVIYVRFSAIENASIGI